MPSAPEQADEQVEMDAPPTAAEDEGRHGER
jgi:hypothetical protein